MNISKLEQRVLHVLAMGGAVAFERGSNGKLRDVTCVTREGHVLSDCTLSVVERLRKRRLIRSRGGGPYRATQAGLLAVRAQLDQR